MADVVKEEFEYDIQDDCILEQHTIVNRFEPWEMIRAHGNIKQSLKDQRKAIKKLKEYLDKLEKIIPDVEKLEQKRKDEQDMFLKGEVKKGEV